MTQEELLVLIPVVAPVVTALVGLFIPSPGPKVVKWSSASWASLAQRLAVLWQSKSVQAEVALEISPTMQAVINQAVIAALAAAKVEAAVKSPGNVWITAPALPVAAATTP